MQTFGVRGQRWREGARPRIEGIEQYEGCDVNREMWIPISVLVAVIGLIGVLVFLGQSEESAVAVKAPAAEAPVKAKVKAKGKMKEGQLVHKTEWDAERAAAPEGAPNVVVVIVNAMRKDQVTPYGGAAEVTPFLDAFAKKGAAFEEHMSTAPWNKAAVASMLTGHHAVSIGLVQPSVDANERRLADAVNILPERLQEKGWYTAGVTANFNLNRSTGLAQGFDIYRDSVPMSFAPQGRLHAKGAVPKLLKFLDDRPEEAKSRPVYAQLMLVDPHKPLMVKPDEFRPFEGDDHTIAPYRAVLRRVDDAFKRLVTGLSERGMTTDNTVFVLVADHGEGLNMPQHHGKQHGRTLYRSVIDVPWIVVGPGVKSGARIAGLSSHVDVMPTVLALAGVPIADEAMPGRDLSASLKSGAPTGRDKVYADTWYFAANHAAVFTSDKVCQKDFGTPSGIKIPSGCYARDTDPDGKNVWEAGDEPVMKDLEAWRAQRVAEYESWPELADVE